MEKCIYIFLCSTFLSTDEPERIIQLIQEYPEFQRLYETLFQMCQNVERVMEMFSKELEIIDRNTVIGMIDEMGETIQKQGETIQKHGEMLAENAAELLQKDEALAEKDGKLSFNLIFGTDECGICIGEN